MVVDDADNVHQPHTGVSGPT